MKTALILVVTSLWFGHATAATHAVACNGCDQRGMYDAAVRTTSKGTVYVFDDVDGDARKFNVDTEIISLRPYWAFTWGDELPIESNIQSAFKDYVVQLQIVHSREVVELPPDFPVRSVAGVMLEPGPATLRIVDYLRSTDSYERTTLTVNSLVSAVLSRNIPLVNLSQLLKTIKLIVRFPDGSTVDYELSFSINALTTEASLELKLVGGARLYDGSPAPMNGYGFRDFYMDNQGQSVYEWMRWAVQNGVPVYDGTGGRGTRMSCSISGSTIRCTVYGK